MIDGFQAEGRKPESTIIATRARIKSVILIAIDKIPPLINIYLPTASLSIKYSGNPSSAMVF